MNYGKEEDVQLTVYKVLMNSI